MSKKMLIDASHPEETRVVVVNGTRVEELDYESENKRQLRGNVYLARVTRVEPSLQAAFVEYGGNRHGFLAFSEIHPDYYQIPHEDRVALLEAEEAESVAEDEAEETEIAKKEKPKAKKTSRNDKIKTSDTEQEDGSLSDDDKSESDENTSNNDDGEEDVADASEKEVEDEQNKMLGARRKRQSKRRYKIQEVIKRGQILLIQAVKEERGNKGAAMTSYLSLAGRYCVLMPNTPRGGGISRKISNGSDRKRLKKVMSELSVPQGMGVIVRTAGAKRTKVEIKRDYDYLSRLWDTIRNTTLESTAPALIHEEGNLVKRSIRDLYGKDIDSVQVQGDEAYRLAKNFIKMLMPSHAKNVQPYKDDIPLFLRYQVEQQIEACLEPIAQLKSGGYLVIHPTEALVSIDVNSGRSTKERNVERTALKTNLEAAEELARQMRLRDLAGLIVVDFIDMDENRNNRAVEKKMREALNRDRARVQMSRISQFGLMEISRQRRRRSLLEGSTASCQHCHGVGRKRSVESSALKAVRAIEEEGIRDRSSRIRLTVAPDVATYLFNEKRDLLNRVDTAADMFTEIIADPTLIRPKFEIERVENKPVKGPDPLEEIIKENRKTANANKRKKSSAKPKDVKVSDDTNIEDENKPNKRKRRRGRRGGRGRRNDANQNTDVNVETNENEEAKPTSEENTPKAKLKTSGRRRKPSEKTTDTSTKEASIKEPKPTDAQKAKPVTRGRKKTNEDANAKKETKTSAKRKPARKKAEPKTENNLKAEPKKKTKPASKASAKTTAKPKSQAKTKPAVKAKAKPVAKAKTTAKTAAKTKPPTKDEKPKSPAPRKPKAVEEKPVKAKAAKEQASEKKPAKQGWWKKRNPFG